MDELDLDGAVCAFDDEFGDLAKLLLRLEFRPILGRAISTPRRPRVGRCPHSLHKHVLVLCAADFERHADDVGAAPEVEIEDLIRFGRHIVIALATVGAMA